MPVRSAVLAMARKARSHGLGDTEKRGGERQEECENQTRATGWDRHAHPLQAARRLLQPPARLDTTPPASHAIRWPTLRRRKSLPPNACPATTSNPELCSFTKTEEGCSSFRRKSGAILQIAAAFRDAKRELPHRPAGVLYPQRPDTRTLHCNRYADFEEQRRAEALTCLPVRVGETTLQ
jgi:hypothetical protein